MICTTHNLLKLFTLGKAVRGGYRATNARPRCLSGPAPRQRTSFVQEPLSQAGRSPSARRATPLPSASTLRNSLPPFRLSFPSYHFGVAEAPQRVSILAPGTPGGSNSLQFGTAGKAIFQRFLGNVRMQSAVGVGIRPCPRCGRVGVGHGRCRYTSFDKSRLAEPMSKITPSVRLPAVTSRKFIIQSQEPSNSLVLRIKRCASQSTSRTPTTPPDLRSARHCRSASTGRRKCCRT